MRKELAKLKEELIDGKYQARGSLHTALPEGLALARVVAEVLSS